MLFTLFSEWLARLGRNGLDVVAADVDALVVVPWICPCGIINSAHTSVAHTTLDVTRDRPTETDLKVFPELSLRGEYRLVGAVVQKHKRDERDHDLKKIASNNLGWYGVIHATFDQNILLTCTKKLTHMR